jgi:hypothetical protein
MVAIDLDFGLGLHEVQKNRYSFLLRGFTHEDGLEALHRAIRDSYPVARLDGPRLKGDDIAVDPGPIANLGDRLIGNFRWAISCADDSDYIAAVGNGPVVFRKIELAEQVAGKKGLENLATDASNGLLSFQPRIVGFQAQLVQQVVFYELLFLGLGMNAIPVHESCMGTNPASTRDFSSMKG